MNRKIYGQLSIMMFLQIFVWGAWFVTLGNYLSTIGFSGAEIGTAYLTNNIGAIISPLFIGLIADRYFAADRMMAYLHLLGGAVLYYVSDLEGVGAITIGLLFYNACYMPTVALSNAVCFNQMTAPDVQFPKIRVWGTIGWIIAGLLITFVLGTQIENVEATALPMKMAAVGSLILGAYCFTLPHTPPRSKGKKTSIGDMLGFEAFALLKDKSFAIFSACSLLISIPLAFYYAFANLYLNEIGMTEVAAKMTLGQVSEVGFMVLMPFFFRRLGVKWMLLVGMLAWVVRYGLFSIGDMDGLASVVYLGILLHGVCYDFFFVTGMIYTDKKAPPEVRNQAQSLVVMLTQGLGLGIGAQAFGWWTTRCTVDGSVDFTKFWYMPAAFALAVMALAAIQLASRFADRQSGSRNAHTFGLYRLEILAAFVNALLLFGVALWVLVEAVRRLGDAPEVLDGPLLIVATLGLVANLVALALLHEGSAQSLNVQGAYLEVLADVIGSVGVILSALLLRTFGWTWVDPVIGALIGESIGFWLGRWLGPHIRVSWLGRRIGEHNWVRAENYLERRGGIAIFLSRFLPVLHSLVPLTVGMTGYAYRRFLAWTAPACILWAAIYVSVSSAAAGTYRDLAEGGDVPPLERTGVVLAGDLFAQFGLRDRLEQVEPAVKVLARHVVQRAMDRHRISVIGAGAQEDGRPEPDHLVEMDGPGVWCNPRGEDRPESRFVLHGLVEAVHQSSDAVGIEAFA